MRETVVSVVPVCLRPDISSCIKLHMHYELIDLQRENISYRRLSCKEMLRGAL